MLIQTDTQPHVCTEFYGDYANTDDMAQGIGTLYCMDCDEPQQHPASKQMRPPTNQEEINALTMPQQPTADAKDVPTKFENLILFIGFCLLCGLIGTLLAALLYSMER